MSMTFDDFSSEKENKVKWGIVEKILLAGYEPNFFFPYVPEVYRHRVRTYSPWTVDRVEEVMRGCIGAAMLGFPRWVVKKDTSDERLASEYTHLEAGLAHSLGIPKLMVLGAGVPWRGAFTSAEHHICQLPQDANAEWLSSPAFEQPFADWLERVKERFDVFLGYSGKAKGTAQNLRRFLEARGARVLDWMEFDPGTILEQIEKAAARCTGGIFLFTQDEELLKGDEVKAAPRDNVVFEAGYFVKAKGHERVLIVRQEGAKMPADLGGAIYAPLRTLTDIEDLSPQVERFLKSL